MDYKNKNDYCEIGEEIIWHINGTKFDSHELASKYLEDMFKISKKEASKYLEQLMVEGKEISKFLGQYDKKENKFSIWQSVINFLKGKGDR